MTDKQIKVGDVTSWDEVPSGALVRENENSMALYTVRFGGAGMVVGPDWMPFTLSASWKWQGNGDAQEVTIIALGLTGQKTAAELQRLAEVFEVREAWLALPPHEVAASLTLLVAYTDAGAENDFDSFYRRLHAAGWRPGMTVKDAARLLAEAG